MKEQYKQKYKVVRKKIETKNVFTLDLMTLDDKIPNFTSGQFINIYFPELNTPEGKAYSISSASSENRFSITVKIIGEFSNKLFGLNVGDIILASLPYGYFFSESDNTRLVMIASGIGVTPLRSMIFSDKNLNREMHLYYSVRNIEDLVFKDQFDSFSNENFKTKYYITREKNNPLDFRFHRIATKEILDDILNIDNVEFMICGSISFTRDMWHGLKALGIPDDAIYTEAFFSH